MSLPPLYIGSREVLESAKTVLETHLADLLSLYNAQRQYTLPVLGSVWLYEMIEREWQSVGVGIDVTASTVLVNSALGSQDVAYTLQCMVVMRSSDVLQDEEGAVDVNLSWYRLAVRDYCDAIGSTLQTYMPLPTYAATSYVYRVDKQSPTGQIDVTTGEGDYTVAMTIELIAYQRVAARIPYEAS